MSSLVFVRHFHVRKCLFFIINNQAITLKQSKLPEQTGYQSTLFPYSEAKSNLPIRFINSIVRLYTKYRIFVWIYNKLSKTEQKN